MIRHLAGALCLLYAAPVLAAPRTLTFEAFGLVDVYGETASQGRLSIVLADHSVSSEARASTAGGIAADGGLAAVVDVERYIDAMGRHPETCAYHSWEFEKLSKFVQKTMQSPRYEPPPADRARRGGRAGLHHHQRGPARNFRGTVRGGPLSAFSIAEGSLRQ